MKNWLLKKILERQKKKVSVLDKILFGILAVGFVMALIFFAYLIWFALTNRSVTYFLPAKKTVAYFELEDSSLPTKLSQGTLFDLIGVSAVLQQKFGVDIKDMQDHLTQGRLGLALVQNDNGENKVTLFFRTKSKSSTIDYFKSLGLPSEQLATMNNSGDTIYTFPQSRSFAFSFVGPYLFIAEDTDTLTSIQSVYHLTEPSLNQDAEYQKTLSNLPKQVWGRGYLNIKLLHFAQGNPLNQLADPLKNLINHFAITIRKEQNGFHFNTLLSIDPSLLSLNKGYTDPTRFAYSLADYIGSKNTAAYIGGANLTDEWENTLDTISQMNPAYGIILEGILNAQVSKIFGNDVSLRDDIYPLFSGEYALVFENTPPADATSSPSLGIKLILKHSDPNFVKTKLEKLMKGFGTLAGQFAPKLKVVPLPDGTESKELVADSTHVKETNENYKNYDINCLDIPGSVYGFCYTVTDQLIVMANHLDSIKETIDLSEDPRFVLSQSQPFRQTLSNLSSISDEISFVSLDNLGSILGQTNAGLLVQKMLSSFEAVTWIKQYFNDGVSTEGFLLIK
jgi:hypothetical protein